MDSAAAAVPVIPAHGSVLIGQDRAGRSLRISGHPESDRVILSIWQGATCQSTIRLATEDVPGVVEALVRAALPAPARHDTHAGSDTHAGPSREASVTPLRTRIEEQWGDLARGGHDLWAGVRTSAARAVAALATRIGPPPRR